MLWQVQAPQKALACIRYILHLACDHHTVEPLHKVQLLDCCLCGVTLRRSWLPEQASLEEEPVSDIVLAEDNAQHLPSEVHGQTSARSVYAALGVL